MEEIVEVLMEDYKSISRKIKDGDLKPDEYEMALKERDNIRNELIKIYDVKAESEIKTIELKNNQKHRLIEYCITGRNFCSVSNSTNMECT